MYGTCRRTEGTSVIAISFAFCDKERFLSMFRQLFDASSLERARGLWRFARRRGYRAVSRMAEVTESFWLSGEYFPALLGVFILALAADRQVAGAAVLIGTATWFLAACPDFLAAVCPLTLAILLAGPEYEDLTVFLPCIPLLCAFIAALILHFFIWPVHFRLGTSWRGLALVSVATVMSGCDVLSLNSRTTPLMIYYTLGLGLGMLALYVIFRSQLFERKQYDVQVRFAQIWLVVGLGMAAVVAALCIRHWDEFAALAGAVPKFKCRNFCATVLLTTLPAAFYLSRRSRWYAVPGVLIAAAMLFTGSRSALVFGTVLLALGCVYMVRFRVISRSTMTVLLMMAGAFLLCFGLENIKVLYQSRLTGGHLISGSEERWALLAQSVVDFLDHPAFGVGLGNTANSYLFTGVPGSMFFYHNMPAQIAGSMGVLGVAAYGRLINDRVALLWQGRRDPFVAMLAMSYLGMLMVSMTNPGEFCPFPNAAMMVMLFAMVEDAVGDVAVPAEQLIPGRTVRYPARTAANK